MPFLSFIDQLYKITDGIDRSTFGTLSSCFVTWASPPDLQCPGGTLQDLGPNIPNLLPIVYVHYN